MATLGGKRVVDVRQRTGPTRVRPSVISFYTAQHRRCTRHTATMRRWRS
jgi:hypothetical protein